MILVAMRRYGKRGVAQRRERKGVAGLEDGLEKSWAAKLGKTM